MTKEEWDTNHPKASRVLDKYLNSSPSKDTIETVDSISFEEFLEEKTATILAKRSKKLLFRLFKLFDLRVVYYQDKLFYNIKDIEHLNTLKKPKGMKAIGLGNIHKAVMDRLSRANIKFETEKRFDQLKLPFDIYIPEKNLAIEIQGPQHFFLGINWTDEIDKSIERLKNQLDRDSKKINYCRQNKIDVIWITVDTDIDDLFLYLDNKLDSSREKWLHRGPLEYSIREKNYDDWILLSYDKDEFLKRF